MVDTYHVFDAEVLRHVDFKPVAGLDQVLIPGDPGRKTRIQRTQNGIPLPDDTRGGDSEYRPRGRRQRRQHPEGDCIGLASLRA
ncbi:hypothetical protein [Bradyrhizobium diazoefficiens]|uniref:hypothetical protein n=1 Tax=Bradyrhizobium diazoefficiens TaxID=1355477 RepID=UPI0035159006